MARNELVSITRWDHRKWGTASDPIHQSDLNDIASQNGCPQRFAREKRARANGTLVERDTVSWKPTLGTAVHGVVRRALSNPEACAAVLAGRLPSPTRVLDVLEQEIEVAREGRTIDWYKQNPGNARGAAMHMCLGALRTVGERCVEIVAVEAPFAVEIDGYHLEGTFDLVARPRANPLELMLADWKTGERALDQIVIDHGYQTAIYSHALAAGRVWPGTERERVFGQHPAEIYIVHLRHFVPYVRDSKKGARKGSERGKAWLRANRQPDDVNRLRVSLRDVVGTVRMGRFTESIGEQCRRCPFKDACLGAGHGPTADEAKHLEDALDGIDVSDLLPEVA